MRGVSWKGLWKEGDLEGTGGREDWEGLIDAQWIDGRVELCREGYDEVVDETGPVRRETRGRQLDSRDDTPA